MQKEIKRNCFSFGDRSMICNCGLDLSIKWNSKQLQIFKKGIKNGKGPCCPECGVKIK